MTRCACDTNRKKGTGRTCSLKPAEAVVEHRYTTKVKPNKVGQGLLQEDNLKVARRDNSTSEQYEIIQRLRVCTTQIHVLSGARAIVRLLLVQDQVTLGKKNSLHTPGLHLLIVFPRMIDIKRSRELLEYAVGQPRHVHTRLCIRANARSSSIRSCMEGSFASFRMHRELGYMPRWGATLWSTTTEMSAKAIQNTSGFV